DLFTVDGNWGEWSDFSNCSTTCDGGTQNRTRLCDNPEPSNDGATCSPPGSETRSEFNQFVPLTPFFNPANIYSI
ncbi:hypothetical protein LOTGIDRAFT_123677, partial [Lottia gigantea]